MLESKKETRFSKLNLVIAVISMVIAILVMFFGEGMFVNKKHTEVFDSLIGGVRLSYNYAGDPKKKEELNDLLVILEINLDKLDGVISNKILVRTKVDLLNYSENLIGTIQNDAKVFTERDFENLFSEMQHIQETIRKEKEKENNLCF